MTNRSIQGRFVNAPSDRPNHYGNCVVSLDGSLQDLLELVLLVGCQAARELDLDAYDEVAALAGLLALRHAQAGVAIRVLWRRGTRRLDRDVLAVDGLDRSGPAGEGLLEVDLHDVLEIVALALV